MSRRSTQGKKNLEKAMPAKRIALRSSRSERLADWCTTFFGTSEFLFLHVILFSLWILFNSGMWGTFFQVDPYPFNFLTTTVSLEAIFLSIVVLMSENRAARIANVRDEVDLQINVQAEREVTKILEMLEAIEKRLHVAQKVDPELLEMLRKIDMDELERRVVKAIGRSAK